MMWWLFVTGVGFSFNDNFLIVIGLIMTLGSLFYWSKNG